LLAWRRSLPGGVPCGPPMRRLGPLRPALIMTGRHRGNDAASASDPRDCRARSLNWTVLSDSPASIGVHDRAQHDTVFIGVIIARATVHRGPFIPHQHVTNAPMVVIDKAILRCVVGKFLNQWPGLLAAHADEAMRVHRVDKQDRPTAHGMLYDRGPPHFIIDLLGLSLVIAI